MIILAIMLYNLQACVQYNFYICEDSTVPTGFVADLEYATLRKLDWPIKGFFLWPLEHLTAPTAFLCAFYMLAVISLDVGMDAWRADKFNFRHGKFEVSISHTARDATEGSWVQSGDQQTGLAGRDS